MWVSILIQLALLVAKMLLQRLLLPEAGPLFKSAATTIRQAKITDEEKMALAKELGDELVNVKRTKNTRRLEALVERLKERCGG